MNHRHETIANLKRIIYDLYVTIESIMTGVSCVTQCIYNDCIGFKIYSFPTRPTVILLYEICTILGVKRGFHTRCSHAESILYCNHRHKEVSWCFPPRKRCYKRDGSPFVVKHVKTSASTAAQTENGHLDYLRDTDRLAYTTDDEGGKGRATGYSSDRLAYTTDDEGDKGRATSYASTTTATDERIRVSSRGAEVRPKGALRYTGRYPTEEKFFLETIEEVNGVEGSLNASETRPQGEGGELPAREKSGEQVKWENAKTAEILLRVPSKTKRPGKTKGRKPSTMQPSASRRKTSGNGRKRSDQAAQDEKHYLCTECKKYHKRPHKSSKRLKCDYCKESFSSPTDKIIHEREEHTTEKLLDVTVSSSSTRLAQEEGEKYHCKQCDKSFVDILVLKTHERTHRKKVRYQCDICGKSFTCLCLQKSHAIVHKRESMEQGFK